MTPRYLFLFMLFMCSHLVMAQKNILKSADKYFEAELYTEALKYYNQYQKIDKNKQAAYRRGVANYHTNNIEQAIKDLTLSYSLGTEEKQVYLYVGRAMHAKHNFKDAIKFYKNYLRYVEDDEEQYAVIDDIKRCATGISIRYNEQPAFVENLGPSVNSEYDEIHPVQSPTNAKKYYFSSNREDATGGRRNKSGLKDEIYGKYSMDMYGVELNDGNWTSINAFHPLLNTAKNDILMGFNGNGSVMYFFNTLDGKTGEMMTDTFTADRPEDAYPKRLTSPVIANQGDKYIQVFNENTMLFSSQRAGGYGGFDIYIAKRIDGKWQTPVNLGPSVNGPYDEVSPFLAKSGAKLYFSSNRLESMGGFDIFSLAYSMEGNTWNEPKNLGLPINSGRDELSFSLSADGTLGMFTTNRPESKGGYDIYLAYMKDQVIDQLMYAESVPFIKSTIETDSTATDLVLVDNNTSIETGEKVTKTKDLKVREFLNTPLYGYILEG